MTRFRVLAFLLFVAVACVACAGIVGIDDLPSPPDNNGGDGSVSDASADGTTSGGDSGTPSDGSTVLDAGPRATLIAAGANHVCVVATTGDVYCWGNNTMGELGQGDTASYTTPVKVKELGGAPSSIVAGNHHTCVTNDAGVQCWGSNSQDQLDYSGPNATLPYTVNDSQNGETVPPGFTILAGCDFTCASGCDGGGDTCCWGSNSGAQLGAGTSLDEGGIPPPLALLNVVRSDAFLSGNGPFMLAFNPIPISAGSCSTCVYAGGDIYCWGLNGVGEFGDGTTTASTKAIKAVSVSSLDAGRQNGDPIAIAMTRGLDNGYGSHGRLFAGADNCDSPGQAPTTTCVLTGTGLVYCWGYSGSGGIGDGTPSACDAGAGLDGPGCFVTTPTGPIPNLNATQISGGGDGFCAITRDGGAVQCWGDNNAGQGGTGLRTDHPSVSPTSVVGLAPGATQIAVGYKFACAIISNGGVRCWGLNAGQLQDGTAIQGQLGTTDRTSEYLTTPTAVQGFQ